MQLHSTTVMVIAVASMVLVGVLLLFARFQTPQVKALGYWGSAFIMAAAGYSLGGARGHIADWLSIEVANVIFMTVFALLYGGARVFNARQSLLLPMVAGGSAYALFYTTVFPTEFAVRVTLASLALCAYWLLISWELGVRTRQKLLSRRAVTAVGVLSALYYLIRAMPADGAGMLSWLSSFQKLWAPASGLATMLHFIVWGFLLLSMAKEQLAQKHREDAVTDALTGILNRRGFLARLGPAVSQCARTGRPIALMMLDLDHFKTVNDRFGHQTGDLVLQRFADTLKRALPADSLFGRMGGEEFCALVPATDDSMAIAVAEHIRATFEKEASMVAQYPTNTTTSIGIAYAPPSSITPGDEDQTGSLLQVADTALYKAKVDGRNRIELLEHTADLPQVMPARVRRMRHARRKDGPTNRTAPPANADRAVHEGGRGRRSRRRRG